jgi:signal-transduction protein with cAMP-binding, CBS, and nucleotidyltransferase domain
MAKRSIREVMTKDPVTCSASDPIIEAARAMRENDIGDVVVLDDSQQICGILTDRDITVKVVAEGKDVTTTTIGEFCTRDVETLTPDDTVGDAVAMMSKKAIRRLPIVENGKPVGIVSLGDLAVTQDPESVLAGISAAPSDQP